MTLEAVTVKVYSIPPDSPETVVEVALPPAAPVSPPGFEVAAYPVIALPPSEDGGVHDTIASPGPVPIAAVTLVGAPGTAAGTTAGEELDDGPVPTELAAVTVNVYEVPLVRPVTDAEVALDVADTPPGADTTV